MSYLTGGPTSAGLNYEYFCPFCLKVTRWHGDAEGKLAPSGDEATSGGIVRDQNVSECMSCGVIGSNQGRDCPNLFGEHLPNGLMVKRECSSKDSYLFCVDKCRPKVTGLASENIGNVVFEDNDAT